MEKGRDYPTNAIRLMHKYVQYPFETWPRLYEKLIPSFKKLGEDSRLYQKILEEIEQLFSGEDRYKRGELSWEFLQGFSSQRQNLFQKWEPDQGEADVKKEGEESELYELPKRRSELYGCLLAIADAAEQEASDGERIGMTNAVQMIPAFAPRPYETWGRLHDKLIPYLEKMGKKADYYQRLIGLIEMQFSQSDRELFKPLDGSYLHGYYCMRRALYTKVKFIQDVPAWMDAQDMRSALFGKLLGIAERLERRHFIGETDDMDRRATNELRFMTAFAQRPEAAWEILKVKLKPYQRSAGNRGKQDNEILQQLEIHLRQHGWYNNRSLGSIYLHYYYEERNK